MHIEMPPIRTSLGGVAVLALAATIATTAATPPLDAGPKDGWKIEADGARIIGGYGDNFAYDGSNVRPLKGAAQMTVDPDAGTAQLEIRVSTTEASGPIRFSKDQSFSGDIRIVQQLDTSKMNMARIATDTYLHGDTGNEAPVMPRVYNYFATWGPAKVFVNGKEVIPMIGAHTMFTERARGPSGKIENASGKVYSPMLADKTGFTDPSKTEFHFVAHTTEPDADNFPPHTGWVHLHFSNVKVIQKPAGEKIPFEQGD